MWAMMDSFKQELSTILDGVASLDQGPAAQTGKNRAGPADHLHAQLKRDSQQLGLGKIHMLSILQKLWGDVGSGFSHSRSEIGEWMAFAGDCNPATAASLHWDALTSDYSHVVQSTSTKALLMVGDATIAPKSIYQRMAAAVPPHGAHFAVFHGGSHCLFQQADQLPKLICLVEQLLNGSLENNTSQGSLECKCGEVRSLSSQHTQEISVHLTVPVQKFSHKRQWSGDSTCSTRSSTHTVRSTAGCAARGTYLPVVAAAYSSPFYSK